MFFRTFFIVLFAINLSGCVGAVYTGASSAYNNYSIRESASNNWIKLQAINALNSKKYITGNSNIGVTVVNYVVLLTGQTRTDTIRQYAVNLVKNIQGVQRVIDAITVGSISNNNSLQDSWITTKIKSEMLANKYIDATAIKVITTNNGVVFLMGVVPRRMANVAVRIAQQTQGVRKVIRLFEIVTVEAE